MEVVAKRAKSFMLAEDERRISLVGIPAFAFHNVLKEGCHRMSSSVMNYGIAYTMT